MSHRLRRAALTMAVVGALIGCGGAGTADGPDPLIDGDAGAEAAEAGSSRDGLDGAVRRDGDADVASLPGHDGGGPGDGSVADVVAHSPDAPSTPSIPLSCGPGGSVCSPLGYPYFFVITDQGEFLGEGYGHHEILVGWRGDGPKQAVVLALTRPEVGVLSPTSIPAAEVASDFVPCNVANTPSCAGDFQITIALATDPSHPVAVSEVLRILAPSRDSVAECAGPGNVLYVHGEPGNPIHPGSATITAGAWISYHPRPNEARVVVTPDIKQPVLSWSLDFGTDDIPATFEQGTFDLACGNVIAATPPHCPRLVVTGDGFGCQGNGRFQVHEVTFSGATLSSLLVSFEQYCDGSTAPLRGCLRYAQ